MKTPIKIVIVAALAVTAVAAVALKQGGSGEAENAAPAATESGVKADLPRLVDLGAGKCVPCKKMKPILDDLKANYTDRFVTEFIDVWEDPDAGKAYGIEMIPTQIFYDAGGTELFRHTGFYGKEDILGKWKELGVDLKSEDRRR